MDLQFIAARVARFVGEKWSRRLVRGSTAFCLTCVGVALHLRRHADGTGPAHGVLLPSRHHHRIAFERHRRAFDAVDDACRRCRSGPGIHFTLVGQSPGASDHVRAPRDHWNRARLGGPAARRSARCPALHSCDCAGRGRACSGHVGGAPARRSRSRRTSGDPAGLFRARVRAGGAAPASGSVGGNFDRRGRRRFHSARHPAGPHRAGRCRRSHRPRRLATRLRRRRGLSLSLDPRHLAPRCRRHHPRPFRSHRRNGRRAQEFQAEGIVGGLAAAQRGSRERHHHGASARRHGRAPLGRRRIRTWRSHCPRTVSSARLVRQLQATEQ